MMLKMNNDVDDDYSIIYSISMFHRQAIYHLLSEDRLQKKRVFRHARRKSNLMLRQIEINKYNPQKNWL